MPFQTPAFNFTRSAAPTPTLPVSRDVMVMIGTGTGGSATAGTPTRIDSATSIASVFGTGTVADVATAFYSILSGAFYGIVLPATPSDANITSAINAISGISAGDADGKSPQLLATDYRTRVSASDAASDTHASELITAAANEDGVCGLDAPTTRALTLTYLTNNGGAGAYTLPQTFTIAGKAISGSAYVCILRAWIDTLGGGRKVGIHNHSAVGVTAVSPVFGQSYDHTGFDADALAAAGATIGFRDETGGYRMWGGRSVPSSPEIRQDEIRVLRIEQALERRIISGNRDLVGGSPSTQEVLDSVRDNTIAVSGDLIDGGYAQVKPDQLNNLSALRAANKFPLQVIYNIGDTIYQFDTDLRLDANS